MRSTSIRILCLAAATIITAVLPLDAQEPTAPRRPFRRIFGNFPDNPRNRHTLDINVTFAEGYDDNVLVDQLPGGDPRIGEGGIYSTGDVGLTYSRRLGGATLGSTAGSAFQYYPSLDTTDRSHYAGLDFDVPLGSKTRLRLAQSASYATYYTFLGLPGSTLPGLDIIVPGQELLNPTAQRGVSTDGGWESRTGVMLARQLGRRGSLEGQYGLTRTSFGDLNTLSQETSVLFRHGITNGAALRAGYGYQTGSGLSDEQVIFHDLDLGVEYRRSLSRSRNTSVSFSTGSAMLVSDAGRDFRFLADARLVHLMGRSWTASVGYDRGVEYLAALAQPVATDAVTATLAGLVTPAWDVSFSGAAARGLVGGRQGDEMTTYSGTARLQYALTRRLAIDTRYTYYFYEFADTVVLPADVNSRLSRQNIQVGLTFYLVAIR